jgi:hypothetical protein
VKIFFKKKLFIFSTPTPFFFKKNKKKSFRKMALQLQQPILKNGNLKDWLFQTKKSMILKTEEYEE